MTKKDEPITDVIEWHPVTSEDANPWYRPRRNIMVRTDDGCVWHGFSDEFIEWLGQGGYRATHWAEWPRGPVCESEDS